MVAQFLYLSMTGLLLSTVFIIPFGQHTRTNHWLLGFAYSAGLVIASFWVLQGLAGQLMDPRIALLAFLISASVVVRARNWNLFGQVTFSMAMQASVAFVLYACSAFIGTATGAFSLALALCLLLLVIAAMILVLAHTFELVDVICRKEWRRVSEIKPTTTYFPKVSLHVPAYNEPPEMVIETLNALANIDYPNYEVIMIDDNTTEERLWRPVEEHCRQLGFKFYHLDNWPGFKSGALNFAIAKTDPEAEIIGIVDSDYVVEPGYLKDLVGFFENGKVAFVQTPQDYRDFDRTNRFALACYHAYQYFFKVSMASRNERNSIIFTGTMGLIRKQRLQEVGGWDEWCITEDAEVALKLLARGYESIFIDKTYGRGLMPLNFEGLRKQRFRWAFGGMQVLRLHWKKLLPWTRGSDADNQLTLGQKLDYWSGGLQWLNDPITFLFTIILLINSLSYSLTDTTVFKPLAGTGLLIPFILIVFSLSRMLWGLRLRLDCTVTEAFRALLVLFSLTWVVTLACTFGLTKKAGVFLRTPKQTSHGSSVRSLQIVNREMLIVLICAITIVGLQSMNHASTSAWLLSGLLMWQIVIYSSSLVVSRWSYLSESRLSLSREVQQCLRWLKGIGQSLFSALRLIAIRD